MSSQILVVEDHDDSRELLVDFLQSHGFRVGSAANGRIALERMEAGDVPQLVLLDLTMPVMDGWQLRARLLSTPRLAHLPVIVLSAVDNPVLPEQIQGFTPKPVDLDLLLTYVQRYVKT